MVAKNLQISFRDQDLSRQTNRRLSVLIADDHPVVREGIIAAISRQSDMYVAAEARDGREAVAKALAQLPDVCLLDLRMPVMDGIQATALILEKRPAARLIILSSYETQEDIYRAMEAGAHGYVLKESPMDEIFESLRAVASGRTWIPAKVGANLAKSVSDQELTPRETEVLRQLSAGKSNKEIATEFDISAATVKVHVTHILEKLKVTGRTEAINAAVKKGLVRIE